MQCLEKVDYDRQLVNLLAWMHEQAEVVGDKPHEDDFLDSSQFDCVWFVDHFEFLARVYELEMRMCTIGWLRKTNFGWHNVEVFATRLLHHPNIYVPVPSWWVDWELSH